MRHAIICLQEKRYLFHSSCCRLWCDCSVPAKQHWCLLFEIKQGYSLVLHRFHISLSTPGIKCDFAFFFFPDTTGSSGAFAEGRCSKGAEWGVSLYWTIVHKDVILIHIHAFLLLQIWDNVPKPQAHKETPLSEFFNVGTLICLSFCGRQILEEF